ncbi:uncharacterized protein LOC111454534 [Cucurbita moschata]|uniref:Uncharacterized protein LOC111454534 n=1 Tax=Cucurbita moschata TaxID=3662 RepID=A0A6J1GII2_CUCMO|nr:uncharacterized protein LOC111454534 [Cucurbita moschata]
MKLKKRSVSEKDISTFLPRYSPTTVLTLLQEVSQVSEAKPKIDWNEIVKNTSTGISNPREYQMLWRHLAYRHALLDNLEDETAPLEDDSDLECELEPFPSFSCETSTEAAACAKVFIASGSSSHLSLPSSSTIEAPLTINLPRSYMAGVQFEDADPACSIRGASITVPISVQRQPVLTSPSAEGLTTNGSTYGNNASRRKRKPWSEAEDLELMAAVKKCGEGNWANILRGDFLSDRTASQLSQRWAIIKKRHGNLNVGANTAGTQLSEVQLAARHAMSLALDRPVGSLKAARISGSASTNTIGNGSSLAPVASSEQVQDKLHQRPTHTKPHPVGSSSLTAKAQVTASKKMIPKSSFDSDCIVKAAAVAAGARIASPADAACLLKAAQSKNAIHIMAKVPASTKTPTPARGPNHLEAHPSIKTTTLPNTSAVMPSVTHGGGPVKITSSTTATLSSVPTDQNISVASVTAAANPLSEKETKTTEETRGLGLGGVQATAQKDCRSRQSISERVQEEKPADLGPPLKRQATETSNCSSSQNTSTADVDIKVETGNQVEERQNANTSMIPGSTNQQGITNQSQVERTKLQDMDIDNDGKDRPIMKTDGRSENSVHKEAASEIPKGNTKDTN